MRRWMTLPIDRTGRVLHRRPRPSGACMPARNTRTRALNQVGCVYVGRKASGRRNTASGGLRVEDRARGAPKASKRRV